MGQSLGFTELDSANLMQFIDEDVQVDLDSLLEIENSNDHESSESESEDGLETNVAKDISKTDLEDIFQILEKIENILSKDLNDERRVKTKLALKNNFKCYKELYASKCTQAKKQTSMRDFFKK